MTAFSCSLGVAVIKEGAGGMKPLLDAAPAATANLVGAWVASLSRDRTICSRTSFGHGRTSAGTDVKGIETKRAAQCLERAGKSKEGGVGLFRQRRVMLCLRVKHTCCYE